MLENIKTPKILKEEALEVVNTISFEELEEFNYDGTNFLLMTFTQEELEQNPENEREDVFFSASTEIDGWDIYILDSLSVEEKKRRIFHEIIECDLISQGFETNAHTKARQVEEEVFGKRGESQKY